MTRVLAGCLLAAALVVSPHAQQSGGAAAADLSGIWNRLDTGGGGSYHGIDLMFPKAQLLPDVEAKLPPDPDQGLGGGNTPPPVRLANGAYLTPQVAAAGGPSPTAGRCNIRGFGDGIDINSAGVSIVQSKDEVILARDGSAGGRRIFLNRTMPDRSRITPSPGGYSVGRWENGALVVTTTGFAPGLVSFGRGWRDRDTVLTEVFTPEADGRHITVKYTWNDPKTYTTPHTYTIVFERWDGGYVFESWCDASIDHPENYTSIVLPAGPADASKK